MLCLWLNVFLLQKSNKKNVTANLVNFAKDFSFITNVIGKPNDDPRETLFSHPDGFYANALYSVNYGNELCSISTLKSIRKTPRSFYIGKNSTFREDINLRFVSKKNFYETLTLCWIVFKISIDLFSIFKLIERGINYRHQVNFKKKYQYSCVQQETEFNQLTLRYVELGFVPLFCGSLVAVLFELMQRLVMHSRKTKSKQSASFKHSFLF